ncbi:MAG: ribbon-helix-helix protein, CopG family [Dehalococcoidia bacterium]|nr:ribbon-helix-helix protein, CopG family [Dehalococcoidia bacterium]
MVWYSIPYYSPGSERSFVVSQRRKKITLSLDAALVRDIQQLVGEGEAKSQSAFFETALREKVKQAKREKRRKSLLAASKDPLFLADVEEVMRDFVYADAETARMIR